MKGQLTRRAAQDMQIDAGLLLERMGFNPKPLIELRVGSGGSYGFNVAPALFVRLTKLAWKGWQAENAERAARRADAACQGARHEV